MNTNRKLEHLQIMKSLSKKQQEVLCTIEDYYKLHATAPTLEEIGRSVNIKSRAGVHRYLEILESKGYITRTSKNRGIILKKNIDFTSIPVLGTANAGEPLVFAEEEKQGNLEVDSRLLKNRGNLFAVKIDGDSMNKYSLRNNSCYLEDNTYAIIDKETEYNEGDAVLAVINDCATIKVLNYLQNMVALTPNSTNPKHKPIYIQDGEDLFINGKVVYSLENPNN